LAFLHQLQRMAPEGILKLLRASFAAHALS
jgi:hypothetical protein